RRLSSSEAESAADRYRFNTLQGRYMSLCERWEKLQAEKEGGRRPGVHGGFARDSTKLTPTPPPKPNAPAARSVLTGKASKTEEDLFRRYVAARQARGEDVAGYDLAHFVEGLNRERAKLKERFGDVAVEFDVADRDGKVRLVARKKAGS
ncbi:MAG TPA: MXAN_5187 C-terminal domain-containing protein, partial [Thermoanaerobaculia bacterium]